MQRIFFLLVVWSVVFLMHVVVYSTVATAFSLAIPHAYIWLALLSTTYLIASLLVRKVGGVIPDVLYFGAAVWLGTIFILFSTQIVALVVGLVVPSLAVGLSLSLFFLGVVLSVYAVWSGRRLTVKTYTLRLKKLTKPLRVVHLSDIHIGTVHQTRFLEEVVALTNEQKPDLVCITGDLFDGSVEIDEAILSPLNDIQAPVYFSHGNHEAYEGLTAVEETIAKLDVELLANRAVVYGSCIQIIGVNDRQILLRGVTLGNVLDGLERDEALPAILMYHTPVEWEQARARGIEVMLSGHTHNGQIYPFTLLVRLFYKYVINLYEREGYYLHITPGTGTWGPPMRLGSRNQVTVLELVPH